jgi:hypothetical protein
VPVDPAKPDVADVPTRARELELVTVAELAAWLRIDRDYVYRYADELGALRLGSGPRARLRFDLAEVRRRLCSSASSCSIGRRSKAQSP